MELNEPTIRVISKYNFTDFYRISLHYYIRSPYTWVLAGILFIAMVFGIFNGLSSSEERYFESMIISIVISPILILFFLFITQSIYSFIRFNLINHIVSTVVINLESLSVEQSNQIILSFPWSVSTSIKSIGEFYLFYWGKEPRVFLNKKSFSSLDEELRFVNFCKEMIQKATK